MSPKPTYAMLEAKIHALEKEIACRRESDAILSEKDNSYRALVENTPDIFYRTDLNGLVLYASSSVFQQSGYTVDEVIGIDLAQQVYAYPHERETFLKELQRRGSVRNFEARLKRKDGSTWWACTNAQFFRDRDGNVLGVEGITRDITNIKEAEEEQRKIRLELEASHLMLQSVLDAVPDLLIVIDRDFKIQYSNYRGTGRTGSDRAAACDACYGRFKRFKEPCEHCCALPVFDSGRIVEREMFNPEDGRTSEVRAFPIFDAQRNVQMVVEHWRDISDQKRAESERQDYEARIRQMQKMEAIGTLAGGIAHDFNNILVAVIGYAELGLAELPKQSPIHRNLKQILAAGMRARDLVCQILTFSRQNKPELKPLQMSALVAEALKLLRSTLPTTIEITQLLATNLDYVMADPTQIHQIIMNLCTNAAQAMEEEGGHLIVNLSQVELSARMVSKYPDSQPGRYVLLSVRDNGKGIAPDHIDKIFHPYFTTKEKGKGTGLGLAVVHGIVQSYGGFINVQSPPGRGATFNIYIPTIDPALAEEDFAQAELPDGSERILLVDDEPLVMEVIAEMLARRGYQVKPVAGSLEALALFRRMPADFDLVLTDMTMPKMTGERLSNEIKSLRPDIPVILCSGYSEKLAGKNAADLGLEGLLMKPVEQEELIKTIRKVLDGTTERQP
jgi:two-component system cell cycle sensor histidine kinase/response regulator CckA